MGVAVVIILIIVGLIAMVNIAWKVRPDSTHPNSVKDDDYVMVYVGIAAVVIFLFLGLVFHALD